MRITGPAALLALFVSASPASGHGGVRVAERPVGVYMVTLDVADRNGRPPAADLTVTLRRSGRPEDAARVRIAVRVDGAWHGPYLAERVANAYEVVLTQPARRAWQRWLVRIAIDGPGGSARTHVAAERTVDGIPRALVPGSGLFLLGLGAWAVVVHHRRRALQRAETATGHAEEDPR